MDKGGWVYIMANRYRGGMNVGVTPYQAEGRLQQLRNVPGIRRVISLGIGTLASGWSATAIPYAIKRHLAYFYTLIDRI